MRPAGSRTPKVVVRVRVARDVLAAMDACSEKAGCSRSEIVQDAVSLWLDTQEDEFAVDCGLAAVAEARLADGDEWLAHEAVRDRAGL